MRIVSGFNFLGLCFVYRNFCRFAAPQHDIGGADAHLQGTGEAGFADQLDLLASAETQGQQAQVKCFFGMYRGDSGYIAGMQRGKGCCRHDDGLIQK